jgi:hypothetical protein
MSVLCMWPETDGVYTFSMFSDTVNMLDALIKPGGYICIYNAKYLFTETDIFKHYKCVETNHSETGFVTKYHKTSETVQHVYPYFLFQKI